MQPPPLLRSEQFDFVVLAAASLKLCPAPSTHDDLSDRNWGDNQANQTSK